VAGRPRVAVVLTRRRPAPKYNPGVAGVLRESVVKTYRCVICRAEVPYQGRQPECYPFCSNRCRWVDLGRWFNGEYTIDRDLTPEDIATLCLPPGGGEAATS